MSFVNRSKGDYRNYIQEPGVVKCKKILMLSMKLADTGVTKCHSRRKSTKISDVLRRQ